jgi:hypothetical protein
LRQWQKTKTRCRIVSALAPLDDTLRLVCTLVCCHFQKLVMPNIKLCILITYLFSVPSVLWAHDGRPACPPSKPALSTTDAMPGLCCGSSWMHRSPTWMHRSISCLPSSSAGTGSGRSSSSCCAMLPLVQCLQTCPFPPTHDQN